MQSSRPRRVHSPQLKEAVVAECRHPGASVSGVALAYGLNANLVRKWLIGRGLGRGAAAAGGGPLREPAAVAMAAPPMRFVPVALAGAERGAAAEPLPDALTQIHIELRRGAAQLTVRWPSSQAGVCAAWLGELAGAVCK